MLDPITVSQAGIPMAEALGLRWADDRIEIVKLLNKYRELLFTLYADYSLFNDSFHCLCVADFAATCDTGCGYRGITLPPDIVSVENIWQYRRPLTLRSRYREGHTGIGARGNRLDAVEMAETFCTERDLVVASTLKVFTERVEDTDKFVYVDVVNYIGVEQRIGFRLVGDGWSVSKIKARKILRVSLPQDRAGSVTLSQRDGFRLSTYAPWEDVPNYRRFRLPACGDTVLLQGVKKFQKIYFDHDIVEVGNSLIIEAAGRYFKYGEKTTEAAEINRSALDLKTMDRLLKGLILRHKGGAQQDGTPFRGLRNTRSKSLPGYALYKHLPGYRR